jgi:hypothetical protein
MNKKDFCEYLEETAAEIRAFSSTKTYLDDVCASLIHHTNQFWKEEQEENRIREAN